MMKSVLSVVMVLMAFLQMFLIFEVFGRSEKRYSIAKLMRIHRVNGAAFILLYFFVAYFCLRYIAVDKDEFSPRIALHALLALSVIVLLALKISFIRIYQQFHDKVVTLGLLIALLTIGMMASAGGFYLLVTFFG